MSSDHWWAQFRRDSSERERFLVIACAVLGIGCVCIAYFDPRLLGPHLNALRGLLFAYFAYGFVSLLTTLVCRPPSLGWRWCLHAVGVVLVSLVINLTGAAHSPFLLLYLLALLAAAELWGMRGTLLTSGACVALLVVPLLLSTFWPNRTLLPSRGSGSVKDTITVSVSLIIASYFLGYLAEEAKRRQANALIISRLMGNALAEIGLRGALEGLLHSVRDYFDADQVRLVLRRVAGDEAFLWEANRSNGTEEAAVRFSKLSDDERRAYFATLPEPILRSVQQGDLPGQRGLRLVASRERHGGSQPSSPRTVGSFRALNSFGRDSVSMRLVGERHTLFVDFSSLLAVSFSYQQKWFGRLMVYNSARGPFHRRDARFLEGLVREVAPAVDFMHHLGRLRSRAQAAERTRLAHELHDGVIQSLMGLEMQTDLVRRHASGDPARLLKEVGRLQELLRKEIMDFRERMQILKPMEVEPSQLVKYLADTVDQFQRDQPISASFVCDCQEVFLPPRVCSELVRSLQEALVNIRKHSGAQKALVRFGRENGTWKLVVEDDGCGFGFSGRLSLAELDAGSLGPRVIKERMRSIGADLVIESIPGCGARLEITLLPVAYEQSA